MYHRKRASRHYCAPSSFPFTVDVCNVIQSPVFVARLSRCFCWTGALAIFAAKASSVSCALRRQTAVRPSRRQAEWSAVRNPTWPLSAATRCPVTKQDAVQFSGTVFIESIRASLAYFTGRRVNLCSSEPYHSPSKRAGKKVSCSAFSTRPKALPIRRVASCKNYHSCWNDFCGPA